MESDPTNATVVERTDLTAALSLVKIRPDSGTIPGFVPGQFLRLGVPRPQEKPGGRIRYTRRAYSIASSPLTTDHVEFFVVRIEEGALTPRLWEIEVGGRVWMDAVAKGEFTIDAAPADADLVMVSTGTGVAPFVSMLRTYRGQNRWRRFVLINGVRYAPDLGFRDELDQIARDDPTVQYIPLVTRESAGGSWPGQRGRVLTVLEPDVYQSLVGAPLDPARCHVFLCGNPAMIDGVEVVLNARGFVTDSREQRGNLHFERYW